MRRSVFLLFLFSGLSFYVFAQGVALGGTSNTYALIVGVSDYEDPKVKDLYYAHIDAQKFADYLRSPAGGNVPEENIHLLKNEEATTGVLEQELTWWKNTPQPGDKAYLVFSGHAEVQNKVLNRGYFMLHNSQKDNLSTTALSFDDLSYVVAELNLKGDTIGNDSGGVEVILIFDACRSGALEESSSAAALKMANGFKNTIRLLSCKPSQDSEEAKRWGGGRGAFSFHLVAGLVGKADTDPADGWVTLEELEDYLKEAVPEKTTAPQNPQIKTDLDNDYLIAMVDQETLQALNDDQAFSDPVMSRSIKKGRLEAIEQAGSQVQEWYKLFEERLDEEKLLRPEEDCAEFYYNQLIQQKELESLHSYLTGNYAAVLQDATISICSKLAKADSLQKAMIFKEDPLFQTYPKYLNRAIELLGPDHYMHQTLMARKFFFEGLIRQIEARETGKKIEDLLAAIESQRESLKLQPDNVHAWTELGMAYIDLDEYDKALESLDKAIQLSWYSPTSILPFLRAMIEKYPEDPFLYDKYVRNKYIYASGGYSPLLRKEVFWLIYQYYSDRNPWPSNYISKQFKKRNYKETYINTSVLDGNIGPGKLTSSQIEWWKKAIEVRPDVAVHYFQLATIMKERGLFEEAEPYARQFHEMEPNDAKGTRLLKKILKKNGKKEEAKNY
jgi:tetratricopeptide (TPR) repeat protein